jgi:HD-like signal output (HDOD) protein/DNA-binding NarL/FixJ family response regulator
MPQRRLKALIVDDEKGVRSLLIGYLFRQGFLCNEAEDGAKALRELEHAHYDLVVTDLRMPNRHGHALCQAILDQSNRPRLVVVTGVADPRIVRDLRARGVDHIFQKPIDLSEFVSRIRELTQSSLSVDQMSGSRNRTQPDSADTAQLPAVAVLLHDTCRAQALAAQFKRESLLPFVPESTDALCHLAESRTLDLLVLEESRFGFLNSRDLVGHLKTSGALTEIFLLADETASSSTVADWPIVPKLLLRNATDADVLLAVRGKLASMSREHGSVSAQARELVRPFTNLASVHQSLLRLATYLKLSGPELSPDRLAVDVRASDVATAEILRLAKGASAGLRGQIDSVEDAINRIGATRSVALLVSSGIKGAEKPILRRLPAPLREWYQRRRTLNATIASAFAQKQFGVSGDVAFVLGLVQDIGITVLGATFEDRYARLVSRARTCGPTYLQVVEREDLGIEHSEISAALLEQWGFPDELLKAVRFHHSRRPDRAEGRESLCFVESMRIAESVANLCDNRHPSRRQELLGQLAACCDAPPAQSLRVLEESAQHAAEIAQQFRSPFTDEALLRGICAEVLGPAPAGMK